MVKFFVQCNHAVFLFTIRLMMIRIFYRKSSVCKLSIVAQIGSARAFRKLHTLLTPADYHPSENSPAGAVHTGDRELHLYLRYRQLMCRFKRCR